MNRFLHSAHAPASIIVAATLLLAGCTPVAGGPTIDELRQQFIDAGGDCETWTTLDEPRAVDAILCDSGAKLYTFVDYSAQEDVVKTELEVNKDIRARTHVMLSDDFTLIIDRIGVMVTVMQHMPGIIQGRNGANP